MIDTPQAQYSIEFSGMHQINEDTGTSREVKREDIKPTQRTSRGADLVKRKKTRIHLRQSFWIWYDDLRCWVFFFCRIDWSECGNVHFHHFQRFVRGVLYVGRHSHSSQVLGSTAEDGLPCQSWTSLLCDDWFAHFQVRKMSTSLSWLGSGEEANETNG